MKPSMDIKAEHVQCKRKASESTTGIQPPCKKSRRTYVEDHVPFQLGGVYRKHDIDERYGGLQNEHMSLAFNYPLIIIYARKSNPMLNDGLKDNRYIFTSIIREGDLEALAIRAAIKEHKKREKRIALFSKPLRNGHVRFLGELVYESHMAVFIKDRLTKGIEFTFGLRSWYQTDEISASESISSSTLHRTSSNSDMSMSSDSISQSSPLSRSEEIAVEHSLLGSPFSTHELLSDNELSMNSVSGEEADINQLCIVPLFGVEQQLQGHPLEFHDELSFCNFLHNNSNNDEDNAWLVSNSMDNFPEFSDFFA